MSAKQYPFIDVAVHERVRLPFARGEAVVLFSKDMSRVLWSNGRGAALFGEENIYDFLDAGPDRGDVAFRQLSATAQQLRLPGDRRSFVMRIGSGFRSVPVTATVEAVTIRPGDETILFSAPVAAGRQSQEEAAAAMLTGFDDPDTHMAVLDGEGAVIAGSDGFDRLAISPETRRTLVEAAGRSVERLVKRPVATGLGHLPAAIGRISSDPALHLLFAVETILGHLDPDEDEAEPVAAQEIVTPEAEIFADAVDVPTLEDEPVDETTEASPGPVIEAVPIVEESALESAAEIEEPAETVEEPQLAKTLPQQLEEPEEATQAIVSEDANADAQEDVAAEAGDETAVVANEEADQAGQGFVFNRQGRPIRFVWKIDAEGRFSEISDEFASAVGPRASAISGARFVDVAARFDLDPDGKIGDLLSRRDTWSGKTILWPVEGTSLVVPVDLAALPTYSRNREFDGFRGFGIVRIADAVEDPNAVGLTLSRTVPEDAVEAEAAVASPSFVMDAPELTTEGAEASTSGEPVIDPSVAEEPVASEEPEDSERPATAEDISADAAASEYLSSGDLPSAPVSQDEPSLSGRQVPSLLDWPAGERPALRIVENAGRRHSDKVIQLEERRSNRREGLT
ncbi:MAG: PAS domain-containing sensor histidine kinase, partial [Shinella sp.]|nr:PAS domain-containing sensor histidine kinase [Shinella sp.]